MLLIIKQTLVRLSIEKGTSVFLFYGNSIRYETVKLKPSELI